MEGMEVCRPRDEEEEARARAVQRRGEVCTSKFKSCDAASAGFQALQLDHQLDQGALAATADCNTESLVSTTTS